MEMKYLGIDTAAKISASAAQILRQNDILFAVRYLVPESGNTAWKALSAAEAEDIRSAGVAVMLCWETTANRVKGGASAGAADATTAKALAEDMGIPAGTAIFFAADYNVPDNDFSAVYDYLYAASVAAKPYAVGLYGHEKVVHAMAERKVCKYFWQCCAWSNMLDDATQVWQYQWQGGAEALALAEIVGFSVDLDSAASLDGMWMPEKKSTEEEDALRWAREMGIIDDTMRDVTQTAVMLWRYHRIYSNEDEKKYSGLVE